MRQLDLHHGAAKGLSIPPTANVSANQTGVGIDLSDGSEIGHAILAFKSLGGIATVKIQESTDDVTYTDTLSTTVGTGAGDEQTVQVVPTDAEYAIQFARTKKYARVFVDLATNSLTNVRLSAILLSLKGAGSGGSSTSPAS
jgi:hypothetical protein